LFKFLVTHASDDISQLPLHSTTNTFTVRNVMKQLTKQNAKDLSMCGLFLAKYK